MQNVIFNVEGNELVIRVDLGQELYQSASGKSLMVATTGGNVPVPGLPEIKVGLNIYKPLNNGRSARQGNGW